MIPLSALTLNVDDENHEIMCVSKHPLLKMFMVI